MESWRGLNTLYRVIERSPLPDWAVDMSPQELAPYITISKAVGSTHRPTVCRGEFVGLARPVNRILYKIDAMGVRLATADGSRPVLQDISFEVGAAEIIGIVGCSGVEKTTLLRVLGGLLRESSDVAKRFSIGEAVDVPPTRRGDGLSRLRQCAPALGVRWPTT